MKLLCFALILTLASGCAFNQSISLLDKSETLLSPQTITIHDRRDEAGKKTRLHVDAKCVRWYGDEFIAPTKPSYLKHVLAARSSADASLQVTLNRFDTVEYCNLSAARAQSAAVSAVTGTYVTYQIPANSKGDIFLLRIAGEVNGKPFDISKGFDYSDVSFMNFPSESKVYRERVANALNETATMLLELGKK